MSYGRFGVAPCGHTGEAIIGNYYRCVEGCDRIKTKNPAVTGQLTPMTPRRGELGHIDGCMCNPCQIRRGAVAIELRTRDGKTLQSLPWNGVDKKLKWTSKVAGHVMNWRMLDKNGNVTASGALEAFVEVGWNMVLDVDVLVDKVAMSITKERTTFPAVVTFYTTNGIVTITP